MRVQYYSNRNDDLKVIFTRLKYEYPIKTNHILPEVIGLIIKGHLAIGFVDTVYSGTHYTVSIQDLM